MSISDDAAAAHRLVTNLRALKAQGIAAATLTQILDMRLQPANDYAEALLNLHRRPPSGCPCDRCEPNPGTVGIHAKLDWIAHTLYRQETKMSALTDAITAVQSIDAKLAADLTKFESDITSAISDLTAKIGAGDTVTQADLDNLTAIATADTAADTSVTNGDAAVVAADPGAHVVADPTPAPVVTDPTTPPAAA